MRSFGLLGINIPYKLMAKTDLLMGHYRVTNGGHIDNLSKIIFCLHVPVQRNFHLEYKYIHIPEKKETVK